MWATGRAEAVVPVEGPPLGVVGDVRRLSSVPLPDQRLSENTFALVAGGLPKDGNGADLLFPTGRLMVESSFGLA